jgi:hypothetical protein
MTSVFKKTALGLAAVSTLAMAASPADAQYRRYRHHGDDAGIAIGAGIIGLGIGAAIASSNRGYGYGYGSSYYDPYYGGYGNGYSSYGNGYDPYYSGGYGGGYGGVYYEGYRRHCTTRRQWDPYYGRWVRVRYC